MISPFGDFFCDFFDSFNCSESMVERIRARVPIVTGHGDVHLQNMVQKSAIHKCNPFFSGSGAPRQAMYSSTRQHNYF